MAARVIVHPRRRANAPQLTAATVVQRLSLSEQKPVALCWSPSGTFLAIAVQHGAILLHYVLPDKQCTLRTTPIRRYTGHSSDVLHMSFSRSNFLLSASMDRCVRLWHVDTALCLRRFVHPDMVTSVSFHPHNDNFVISGGCDGVVRMWRPVDHACVSQIDVRSVITVARFDHTGKHAVVGCYDGTICVLDVANVNTPPPPDMHALRNSAIESAAASAAGGTTSGMSAVLRVERTMSIRSTRRRRRVGNKVVALSALPDVSRLLALCSDGRVHVVDGGTRAVNRVRKGARKEHSMQIGGSLSHDGRWMVLDGGRDAVRVVDVSAVKRREAMRVERVDVGGAGGAEGGSGGASVCCAAFATEAAVERGAFGGGDVMVMAVGDEHGVVSVVWCRYIDA